MKKNLKNKTSYTFIKTSKDLNAYTDYLLTFANLLAVDTETYIDESKLNPSALDPHSSKISLIQVNFIGGIPTIIDVMEIGVLKCFYFIEKIMMNKEIIKVFHNASFDIKQFKSTFGVWIKNIECTKVFMQSLGINTGMKASIFRGHALKDLSRDYFDCDMDKTEGASQWGARPLSNSQLKYAALDVGCPSKNIRGERPLGYKDNCLLLTARNLFRDQLIAIGQEYCMTADQQAMYISSKLEYQGMYVDQELLHRCYTYAEEETNKFRKAVVEELGFTIYSSLDLNDNGEWEEVEVIPDKIKTLLNNNKGLVTYINQHLRDRGESGLDSLQADEVKTYLDTLESDTELDKEAGLLSTGDIEDRYTSINLIKNLLKYKKHSKLLTECAKYKRVINPNTDRVHAGFNSIGTSTGRMSSSGKLNLQQVSSTKVMLEIEKDKM